MECDAVAGCACSSFIGRKRKGKAAKVTECPKHTGAVLRSHRSCRRHPSSPPIGVLSCGCHWPSVLLTRSPRRANLFLIEGNVMLALKCSIVSLSFLSMTGCHFCEIG